MSPVIPGIVNHVSYVSRINHEIHFAWQVQYLMKLEGVLCCSRIVNSVSCIKRIDAESYISWRAQHLVTLEDDLCCFARCK